MESRATGDQSLCGSLMLRAVSKTIALSVRLLLVSSAQAETIYLRSGLSISVTRTQEKDGEILYWVGGDQYSIDKAEVLRIEAGDAPVSKSSFAGSMTSGAGIQDLTRRDS